MKLNNNRRKKAAKKSKQVKVKAGKLAKIDFSSPQVSGPSGASGIPKKSDYFIDPVVFDKMQKVNSMQDFIRIFKPAGYSIRREVVKGAPLKPGEKLPEKRTPQGVTVQKEATFRSILYKGNDEVKADTDSRASFNSGCSSKYTAHTIKPEPGVAYYPFCVTLKKCGGCCPLSLECVTKETVNRTVLIWEVSSTSMNQISMTFLEDASCKCQCIIKSTDCTSKQTYNPSACQCQCATKATCPEDNKEWSHSKCDCICKVEEECTSNLRTWDKSLCRCGCINNACPLGQSRNTESCRCISSAADTTFRTLATSVSKDLSAVNNPPAAKDASSGRLKLFSYDVFSDDHSDRDDQYDHDDPDDHDDYDDERMK